jgi:hypothetical protein
LTFEKSLGLKVPLAPQLPARHPLALDISNPFKIKYLHPKHAASREGGTGNEVFQNRYVLFTASLKGVGCCTIQFVLISFKSSTYTHVLKVKNPATSFFAAKEDPSV